MKFNLDVQANFCVSLHLLKSAEYLKCLFSATLYRGNKFHAHGCVFIDCAGSALHSTQVHLMFVPRVSLFVAQVQIIQYTLTKYFYGTSKTAHSSSDDKYLYSVQFTSANAHQSYRVL